MNAPITAPASVVFTGLGLVLPGAPTVEAARAALEAGLPAFRELPEPLGPGRGAPADLPPGIIPPMQARRLDRASRFAWAAAAAAFQDAGLDPSTYGGDRIALAAGTQTGGSEASEAFLRPYLQRGPEGASPLLFPNCVANAAGGHVAVAFGLKGPSATLLEREAATLAALEQATRWLHLGLADAVLVLGLDALFPLLLDVLAGARLLARRGDPRPDGRSGLLPGEGAQAFLLEREADARARGARLRARLGALACEAPTHPDGDRAAALVRATEAVGGATCARWIRGANGTARLDAAEADLFHLGLPEPQAPKALWGEFCGSGGQLVAAALLQPAPSVLVTAPTSFGAQYALRLDAVAS